MRNLNIVNVKQGSPEWVTLRKDKIGASDAPVILGVSPWTTPFQLMEEKLGLSVREESSSMRYGKEKEEEARQAFESMTGLIMFNPTVVSKKRPWQMASYDGMTLEQDAFVEIKNAGHTDHSIALSGKVPDHYMPQIQQQIELAELDMGFYFSYNNGEGKIVEVKRDQSFIDRINEEEEKFWNMWQLGKMPELTERDYVNMSSNQHWKLLASELIKLDRSVKEKEKRVKEIKDAMKDLCDNRSARGHGVQMTKYLNKGAVDYAKIPELAGVDLEQYRKQSFTKWLPSFY